MQPQVSGQKADAQRYTPTAPELSILSLYISRYFHHPKRSPERKFVSTETAQILKSHNYHYWDDQKVRIWFRNNRDRLVDSSQVNMEFTPRRRNNSALSVPEHLQPPPAMFPQFAAPANLSHLAHFVRQALPPPVAQPLHSVAMELPPLPSIPDDSADPKLLTTALLEIVSYARKIPHDVNSKANRPALFENADRLFLTCLKKFPPDFPPPAIDGGGTVIEMMDDYRPNPIHPLIRIPTTSRINRAVPQVCYPFVQGQYSSAVTQRPIRQIESTLMGFGDDLIYTFYDSDQSCHKIAKGASHAGTGFVSKSTALLFDPSPPQKVWVAGDFRVRAFDLDGFRERDLLYAWDPLDVKSANENQTFECDRIIDRAGLAIWQSYIVLSHGRYLTFWKHGQPSAQVPGWTWRSSPDSDLMDSAIEKRRGRARAGFTEIMFSESDIDCLAVVGDFLAIGSTSGPTIYVVRKVNRRNDFSVEVICRFIGHTMGITYMVARNGAKGPELYSGSKDGTVKVWSVVEQEIQFSLQLVSGKRAEEVTALTVSEWKDPAIDAVQVFVFSGHSDGLVRVWDLTANSPMFEIVVVKEPQKCAAQGGLREEAMQALLALTWSSIFGQGGLAALAGQPGLPQGMLKDMEDAARRSGEVEGERLVPMAIGFNVAVLHGVCELQMIGVEKDGGYGECQCFDFAIDKGRGQAV